MGNAICIRIKPEKNCPDHHQSSTIFQIQRNYKPVLLSPDSTYNDVHLGRHYGLGVDERLLIIAGPSIFSNRPCGERTICQSWFARALNEPAQERR